MKCILYGDKQIITELAETDKLSYYQQDDPIKGIHL